MSDQIATYTFLPWLRQGIASKIKGEDNLGAGPGPGERASVRISLQVNGDPEFVSQNVQLSGPGDVVGVNARAIVRTEPRNWVTDFEPNYLAFIEFYEEDFPWRFTPARAVQKDAAGNPASSPQETKLRPWIFLLALEEGEFEEAGALSGPLPSIRLAGTTSAEAVLPPTGQAWAWAHVHVSQDLTAAGANTPDQAVAALQDLVRQNPDNALSRLVCPRKLKPATAYHAFLIPAFEAGRLAGLGQPTAGIDALTPSWGTGQVDYPIYYRWYFRTGLRGDFEYLVNLLEPREVDERVGIRDMDMQDPNFGATGMSTGPGDVVVMGLEGALKSPQAQPRPPTWPPANETPAFLNDLEEIVNLQETLLNLPDPADPHPDPIISPPLYGRWHALQTRLEAGQPGWVNELNQDARWRTPAGFGTKVIQAGQEGYMQRAWQQLGDILRANQKIRQVQVSIAASMRVYSRDFAQLDPDQQIAVTQQVHRRVMGSAPSPASEVATIHQQLRESRLEGAALQPSFRRVLRPRGPVMRKALPENQGKPTDLLVRLNNGRITAAIPKRAPEGQISLTAAADRLPDKRLREDRLTADEVGRIPPRPAFKYTPPGTSFPIPLAGLDERDSPEGGFYRTALLDLHSRIEITLPAPEPRPVAELSAISATLVSALNPKFTIVQRTLSTISIPSIFNFQSSSETVAPIMAHPAFADPMYRPLRDLSSELLIPNLSLIPNNTITLLETNPKFIEAYMVGLNHEMARELLWREYPTDQRGSYFRQFWSVGEIVNRDPFKDAAALEEELRDIKPLHLWERDSQLGTHGNRSLPTGSEPGDKKLVLVIRGDLLKRYPTAVIFAQKAKWVEDEEDPSIPPRMIRVLDEDDRQANTLDPIFKAEVEPDLHFLGFDLTASKAKGSPEPPATAGDPGNPGWFFVIQERPGEPRFGLDIQDTTPPTPEKWTDLAWNHLGDPEEIALIDLATVPATDITDPPDNAVLWGSNAADMAYILYQVPVMVAIHADNMLK